MRFLLVAILGFGLATAGMFLPWGDKQVVRAECSTFFDSGEGRTFSDCDMSSVDALYWADHLTVDLRAWNAVDGETVGTVSWQREFNDYEATGDKLHGNGGLFWGRPIAWFGIGLAGLGVAAVAATWRSEGTPRWSALYLLLGGAAVLAMGTVLGVGGMALHAGSWAGTSVTRLAPRIGGVLLTSGTFLATFATVRFTQNESLRLRGLLNASPLAPIHDWSREVKDERKAKSVRQKWQWGRPTWMALASVAVAVTVFALPMASKDMTIVSCEPSPTQGFVCQETDYEVQYQLQSVDLIISEGPDDTRSETWSYGLFKERFGGPAHLGAGGVAFTVALGALGGATYGIGNRANRGRRKAMVGAWIAAGTVAAALLFAGTAIILQAFAWAGSPAGHLRPGPGIFVALLALTGMVLAGNELRAKRIAKRGGRVRGQKAPKATGDEA